YREAPQSQRNHQRLKLLKEQHPGGRLLEIGCGAGGFLRLAQDEYEVEGMDISRAAVQATQAEFGGRVRLGNLEQDSLPAAGYDVIAVFNILEHLQRPAEAVRKLFNALADGGLIIGSVPNNGGLVGALVTRIGNYFDRTHCSTYSPDRWLEIFRQSGFRTIDLFGEIN